ncbi:MAG TPA: DNA cytosine methyltransferase [Acetobacteraceae bacterium]|nr:DNA cytosine methyltransferase [Acetobacteraceae bacterium]
MSEWQAEGLDLFSGAGGAACGYERAGIRMTGVDIKPQPRYCGSGGFAQADAMEVLQDTAFLRRFDFIHASPPCQGYSVMRHLPWLRDREYPLLIEPVLERLEAAGAPFCIENVAGARRILKAGWLCGQMFGLPFFRHRYFATDWAWLQPGHVSHATTIQRGRLLGRLSDPAGGIVAKRSLVAWQQGNGAQVRGVGVGHAAGWTTAASAMGIDWMTRDELTQAIPPAYTEYLGRAWLAQRRHA